MIYFKNGHKAFIQHFGERVVCGVCGNLDANVFVVTDNAVEDANQNQFEDARNMAKDIRAAHNE